MSEELVVLVNLANESWRGFRPFAKGVAGSLAWTDNFDRRVAVPVGVKSDGEPIVVVHPAPTVHVRRGMAKWLWGRARIGHELDHARDHSFVNETHHPGGHLCGRVGHAVRLLGFRHLTTTPEEVARFLAAGSIKLGSDACPLCGGA